MANKKTTNSGSRGSKKKKKNSSDDTMKFLLVLVIAGIAVAMIFFLQDKEEDIPVTGTPAPGQSTPAPDQSTPVPTQAGTDITPEGTPAQEATKTPAPVPTGEPAASPAPAASTGTPTPTPTPAPEPEPTAIPAGISAESAENLVKASVSSDYEVLLFNDHLMAGGKEYYMFCAMSGAEMLYPFLIVDKEEGTLHCYDSTEMRVFEFTEFPLEQEAALTATPEPDEEKTISADEAYEILCGYSRESLNIAKNVTEYNAEYDRELTLINGVNCYRINLSEVSDGKVRNRGEFYISTDGTKCYYFDSETQEPVLVEK